MPRKSKLLIFGKQVGSSNGEPRAKPTSLSVLESPTSLGVNDSPLRESDLPILEELAQDFIGGRQRLMEVARLTPIQSKEFVKVVANKITNHILFISINNALPDADSLEYAAWAAGKGMVD